MIPSFQLNIFFRTWFLFLLGFVFSKTKFFQVSRGSHVLLIQFARNLCCFIQIETGNQLVRFCQSCDASRIYFENLIDTFRRIQQYITRNCESHNCNCPKNGCPLIHRESPVDDQTRTRDETRRFGREINNHAHQFFRFSNPSLRRPIGPIRFDPVRLTAHHGK